MRSNILYVLLVLAFFGFSASLTAQELPRPQEIERDINFWTRVYTEITTSSGFIHDSRNLSVVYLTIEFSQNSTRSMRTRQINAARDEVTDALRALADGKRSNLTVIEQGVLDSWPDGVSNVDLSRAVEQVRFQLGQSDRYRAGYVRSGRWRGYIQEVLREQGVPEELVALPHVESSFDPTAYSRVGAAGMWQFTRSTGLRYMRIDHIVDERRDPYLSTVAAARLLKDNYDVLQNWSLAITAYNHGQAGMRNAVRQTGTDQIDVILREYDGRAFGFASRNFYVAFLAASDVDSNIEQFFGPTVVEDQESYFLIDVPDFVLSTSLASVFDIDHQELRAWNPALTEAVWNEDKFIPQYFELRLPSSLEERAGELIASLPGSQRYAAQKPDIMHRIRRGETLSGIADRYQVSQASLMALNNLRNRNFIREGQVLLLPGNDGITPASLADSSAGVIRDVSTYIVRAGDSVDLIASRFGTNPQTIQLLNSLDDVNRIYVGQELRLRSDVETPQLAQIETASQITNELEEGDINDSAQIVTTVISPETSGSSITGELLEPLETNVLSSVQAEMAADPSDYLVASDGTIEVQALETLGHYADWLGIRTQRLRDINGMPFRQAVVIGNRLKLDFSQINSSIFEERRLTYQRQTQEAFFLAYQVINTQDHVIQSGESLWELAFQTYEVPVWLIRQYNPDIDLDRVAPGTIVKFPQLRAISMGDNSQATNYSN